MVPADYTLQRLRVVIAQAKALQCSEFPYDHSQQALERVLAHFRLLAETMESLGDNSSTEVVQQQCAIATRDIHVYLPLLGFILRSTNARNAFEFHRPFLRLAQDVLRPHADGGHVDTCLVMSSEWDFVPYIYHDIPKLPGFILIGLPAPESSNPLLFPLAGHELGHELWNRARHAAKIQRVSENLVLDEMVQKWAECREAFRWREWEDVSADATDELRQRLSTDLFWLEPRVQAVWWAMSQAEETFSDLIGLQLFGESFLYAFAYLLSPRLSVHRAARYPNLRERVGNLLKAAGEFGVLPPQDFDQQFEDLDAPHLAESDQFLLDVADHSLAQILPKLTEMAKGDITSANMAGRSAGEVERIRARYDLVVPAENVKCLTDIFNAAWHAFLDPDLWSDLPEVQDSREKVLKNLVLKNMEVFEIEHILTEGAT